MARRRRRMVGGSAAVIYIGVVILFYWWYGGGGVVVVYGSWCLIFILLCFKSVMERDRGERLSNFSSPNANYQRPLGIS